ncbi:MAG TPA: glycosyltransferase family 1 protein [Chloroflexia bacterium]|nr:glycosyltransferase family 1 protein [Chloroflexia bacterium]
MIIVLSGSIGRLPYGGHAWIDMQYLAGLRALGHDVYYLEECGEESWVYHWEEEKLTADLRYPASYVHDCLEPLGLGSKWIYRAGERSEGMCVEEIRDILSRADLLLVRAVPLPLWRAEYSLPRRRAFIDADPGFTQISLVNGHLELLATVERCERLFTIGQRIGAPDCPVPLAGREWIKTVPPVSLPHWTLAREDESAQATHFTSIMHWQGFREVMYDSIRYGQKDMEFPKFLDLPRHTSQPLKVALTGAGPEVLREHGWEVVDGWKASRTPELYRDFIQRGSRAEFGVAKHGYVRMKGGWFSDRSACYLASGRPVLIEDTGLADWLPLGEGILTFTDLPEAVRGIEAINSDYARHCVAARRLAEEYFASDRVLRALLEGAMS